jgi:hypothetical protein
MIEKIITSPRSKRLDFFKEKYPGTKLILWENYFVDENDFLLITGPNIRITPEQIFEEVKDEMKERRVELTQYGSGGYKNK